MAGLVSAAIAVTVFASVEPAFAQKRVVLVDNATPGRYNTALGTALDGTQAQFPCANCGDRTASFLLAPNLIWVNSILGRWLWKPPSFGAYWSGPRAIPARWAAATETAIVYEIDAGRSGLKDVTGRFGVDNGIFVWLNGVYKYGALAGGAAVPGEYVVNLGDLPPGKNFLQILREDHGVTNGYSVEVTGTSADPPPANRPPFASIGVASRNPTAGDSVSFDASGSYDPDGRIVAYEWDWDGDGQFEANTHADAVADFTFPDPGVRQVGVRVTDDKGATAVAETGFALADPAGACAPSVELGPIHIAAPCIRRRGPRYIAETTGSSDQVSLNGVALVSDAAGQVVFDTEKRTITTNVAFAVQLKNTPLGDVTLFRDTFEGKTWQLPEIRGRGAQSTIPPGGFRIVTFGAGDGCTQHIRQRNLCARLPGNFPLKGQIDLHVNDKSQAVLDAHAALETPFVARGAVRLIADRDNGLHLDALAFRISDQELGVFKLEDLSFRYEAPPVDSWDAALSVLLPTPNRTRVSGEIGFVRGRFNFLKAEVDRAGIPLGGGVELDRFAGQLRLSPVEIGGGLGLRFTAVTAGGDFLYQSRCSRKMGVVQLAQPLPYACLSLTANASLLGQRLASAYFTYFTNGDVDFGGGFNYTAARNILRVEGRVDGWYQRPRFQVEGRVVAKVWRIDGRVDAVVNNSWIAACLKVRFAPDPYAALRLRDNHLDVGLGCDLGDFKVARLRASAAQAGQRTFRLPAGLPHAGLQLFSATAAPVVTLTGPGGERYTTPNEPERVVRQGRFAAVRTLADHRLVIRIEKPSAGVWRITPAPASPAVTQLRTAGGVRDAKVKARVLRARGNAGRERRLVYRIRRNPGQRVRFLEDGQDTTHEIGVAERPRGSIRFRPTDGSDRTRRILAVVEQGGIPRAGVTVARYTAPPPIRPSRPGRLRFRRRGSRVIVRWGAARRADSYRVFIIGSDGRRELRDTSGRKRSLVLRRILPFERLTVSVRGEYGPASRAGPARRGRLKAKR